MMLRRVVDALWGNERRHLELDRDEQVWLDVDHVCDGSLGLTLRRFRTSDIKRTFKRHRIDLDTREMEALLRRSVDGRELIDLVRQKLRYLVNVTSPPQKPPGFRLLHRRFVVAPARPERAFFWARNTERASLAARSVSARRTR